ncbi:MAG: hypothetical protein HZA66_25820 [Rhodopseudomonas palustris]|uniref:Uncharacterized protein n=1 Tax=Rhodopseudomonas palustris TaxID=1076 RepID=A0A933S2P6_RHOPL|nr:hypothetical protein [Rhodopseudomonas palustris]
MIKLAQRPASPWSSAILEAINRLQAMIQLDLDGKVLGANDNVLSVRRTKYC